MRFSQTAVLLLLLVLMSSAILLAAPENRAKAVQITLSDGSKLTGTIVSEDSMRVRLRLVDGKTVVLAREQIARREILETGDGSLTPKAFSGVEKVTLKDKSEIRGRVLAKDERTISIITVTGNRVEIPLAQVAGREAVTCDQAGSSKVDDTLLVGLILADGTELTGRIVCEDTLVLELAMLDGTHLILGRGEIRERKPLSASTLAQVARANPSPEDLKGIKLTLEDGSILNGRIQSEDDSTVSFVTVGGVTMKIPKSSIKARDGSANKLIRITLVDESSLIGRVQSEDALSVSFVTASGMAMKIPKNSIREREDISMDSGEGGEYWFQDPNRSRLVVMTTGHSLPAGQGYFADYELFLGVLSIGITDWFQFTGGITLIPVSPVQAFLLAPKFVPYQTDEFGVAIGWNYVNFIGDNDIGGFSGLNSPYAAVTYGGQRSSFTLGAGWGFAEGESSNPVFNLGGELRASRGIKLTAEGWFMTGQNDFVFPYILGIRFMGEHVAGDFGLLGIAGSNMPGFPFIPILSITYNFGVK